VKIVMVHGRNQQGKDPVVLEKEWREALTYGLARANRTLPANAEFRFPFYGDELARLVAEVEAPGVLDAQARGTETDADATLRGEILEEVALGLGLTREDIEREFRPSEPRPRGPQNWEWVQAILRAIDRVPGVNSGVVDLVTRDVYVYLTFGGVRRKIDRIVADAFDDDETIVISHSLGTVVAYNVLLARAAELPVPRFLTLGSPLGVRALQRHLVSPLVNPPSVASWRNAFDDRDVVALRPLDPSTGFHLDPPILNKRDVKNHTENRHGIAGYLADPVVAGWVVG
jgi:hypothetical protein